MKKNVILFCCILFTSLIFSQTKLELKNVTPINTEMGADCQHVLILKDKSKIIASITGSGSGYYKSSNNFGIHDIWLVKLDSNNEKIWDKSFGGDCNDDIVCLYQTKDGGFIIGSNTCSGVSGNKTSPKFKSFGQEIWIIKIDSNGNKQWEKGFGSTNGNQGLDDIIELSSGNFLVFGGSSGDTITGNLKVIGPFAIKLDKNGGIIYQKAIIDSIFTSFSTRCKVNDSQYIIAGHGSKFYISSAFSFTNRLWINYPWLCKIDTNANLIWSKKLFKDSIDGINKVVKTDNSIYTLGYTYASNELGYTDTNSGLSDLWLNKYDMNGNKIWTKLYGGKNSDFGENIQVINNNQLLLIGSSNSRVSNEKSEDSIGTIDVWLLAIDSNGNKVWDKTIGSEYADKVVFVDYTSKNNLQIFGATHGIKINNLPVEFRGISGFYGRLFIANFGFAPYKIKGQIYPDNNNNCIKDSSAENNIKGILVYNRIENSYFISNDSNFEVNIFDNDSALLSIANLDSAYKLSCNKDSISVKVVNGIPNKEINFSILRRKGVCLNIKSFTNERLRIGSWSGFQLNYVNEGFDTANNVLIKIEIDTSQIDSFYSSYSFTKSGKIYTFPRGNLLSFQGGNIAYKVKFKTNAILGTHVCHRATISPFCNLNLKTDYDSSKIFIDLKCLTNDTVQLFISNFSNKSQLKKGLFKIYEDETIIDQDSFKLNANKSILYKYKINSDKTFTSEIFSNNGDPITPVLVRHNDICALKNQPKFYNPVLNFSRQDDAREYEEACEILRGSYDPNIKSVQPIGRFSKQYIARNSELKYRIDFQNTGTDTAFKVLIIDTLNEYLDITTIIPGLSSHPYNTEFQGRALKFIFDPIKLVDSSTNEPSSHGFVTFKIKGKKNLIPKSRIENKCDIYFDFNQPIRTNSVVNTIFDTIQIFVRKTVDSATDTIGKSNLLRVNTALISAFPNPIIGKFYIQLGEGMQDIILEIITLDGKTVKTIQIKDRNIAEILTDNISKGVYIMRFMSNEKIIELRKIEIR
jgi:hypothetical protein